jgi:hypothetical protein
VTHRHAIAYILWVRVQGMVGRACVDVEVADLMLDGTSRSRFAYIYFMLSTSIRRNANHLSWGQYGLH